MINRQHSAIIFSVCLLFQEIFSQKQVGKLFSCCCFFYKQEAQDDLNKTQCNSGIVYFKTAMLVDGLLYILDGKLNAQISGFYTQF